MSRRLLPVGVSLVVVAGYAVHEWVQPGAALLWLIIGLGILAVGVLLGRAMVDQLSAPAPDPAATPLTLKMTTAPALLAAPPVAALPGAPAAPGAPVLGVVLHTFVPPAGATPAATLWGHAAATPRRRALPGRDRQGTGRTVQGEVVRWR